MNRAKQIKAQLKKVGREVYLADGAWISTPFFAVVSPRWRYSKSDFENERTEIGAVSDDYYSYVGPFDHDISCVSENGFLLVGGVKYAFKKKERVEMGGETLYYNGILKRVWEEEDVLS